MQKCYDAVVVGGGQDGLTCASYLAQAGLDVLLLERRRRVGGSHSDYEYFPGYHANLTSGDNTFASKIVRDLDLQRHGLQFTLSEPALVIPFPDGRAFVGHREHDSILEELGRLGKSSVKRYLQLCAFLKDFAARLRISLFESPPSYKTLLGRLETSDDEAAFSDLFLGSLRDLLERQFESEQVAALVAGCTAVSNRVGPSTPGSAVSLLMQALWVASSKGAHMEEAAIFGVCDSAGIPVGGADALTNALRHSFEAAGGTVRTNCEVISLTEEDSGVQVAALRSGEEIRASAVISNLHAYTTLIDLVEANRLESDLRLRMEALREPSSAFKIGLALDGVPHFVGTQAEQASNIYQFRWAPTLDYMDRAADQQKLGLSCDAPMCWGTTPSIIDARSAPTGKHLMSINISHAPTAFVTGDWHTEKDRFGRRCIDVMSEFIPNLKDLIIEHRFWSPTDLKNEFGLSGANMTHVDNVPSAMSARQPLPGRSDYATPIQGLYLCGSSTFPGGRLAGVSGHNASQTVIADLRAGHDG